MDAYGHVCNMIAFILDSKKQWKYPNSTPVSLPF